MHRMKGLLLIAAVAASGLQVAAAARQGPAQPLAPAAQQMWAAVPQAALRPAEPHVAAPVAQLAQQQVSLPSAEDVQWAAPNWVTPPPQVVPSAPQAPSIVERNMETPAEKVQWAIEQAQQSARQAAYRAQQAKAAQAAAAARQPKAKEEPAPAPKKAAEPLRAPSPPPAAARLAPPQTTQQPASAAYGLLRASSQRIGEAEGQVKTVQASLEAVRKELAGEYSQQKARRRVLIQERVLLQNEVSRLQAYLDKRKAVDTTKTHLHEELAVLSDKSKAAAIAMDAARTKWGMEQQLQQMEIEGLKHQVEANRSIYAMQLQAEEATACALKNRSRGLQEQVLALEVKLWKIQNATALKRQNTTQCQAVLYKKAQVLEMQVKVLNEALKTQTRDDAELMSERKRLEQKSSEVMAQRQVLKDEWSRCQADLKSLDEQIGASRDTYQQSKAELITCKELEGENQMLQEQLNICKAGIRTAEKQ